MPQNRRDFIKTSAAMTVFAVSKVAAAPNPLIALPRHIGLVHGTHFDDEFKDCFVAGLNADGWYLSATGSQKPIDFPAASGKSNPAHGQGQYGGSHGHGVLEQLVRDHQQYGVHLIAVAGGLASQLAAWGELINVDVPFVYLAGRLAQTATATDGKYCGVILNNSAQHPDAVIQFIQLGVSLNDIWLVQNANSDMSALEWKDWEANINGNRFLFFTGKADNDDGQFATEVAKLKVHSPKGIVVSSDPYFRLKASTFVSAMKDTTKGLGAIPICYPFKDFTLNSADKDFLLPKGAVLSSSTGNLSNTAYYQLGKRVGIVLDNSTAGQPVPTAPVESVQWDGSNWPEI